MNEDYDKEYYVHRKGPNDSAHDFRSLIKYRCAVCDATANFCKLVLTNPYLTIDNKHQHFHDYNNA